MLRFFFHLNFLLLFRDLYIPRAQYYRAAAFEIVEELSQKKMVNPEKGGRLKSIAIKYLGALEDGGSQAKPEDLLNQACTEISELYKDDRT